MFEWKKGEWAKVNSQRGSHCQRRGLPALLYCITSTGDPVWAGKGMRGNVFTRPVALTSVVMKSFERLVPDHLKSVTGPDDESAYRQEAEWLELRCGRHNLELNTLKTVEMIVDFRRHPSPRLPLTLSSCLVSTAETFKFLGITISQDLKWATNINSVLKKAQQRMYLLRLLRKHGLPRELLRQFYTAVIESDLCTSITVWFGAATKKDKFRLQRTIKTAEKIVGTLLPTLEELHAARTKTRACKILSDPPHPGHRLFRLLSSGRHYRSMQTRTSRHSNSFFPSCNQLLKQLTYNSIATCCQFLCLEFVVTFLSGSSLTTLHYLHIRC
ncbi:uncharacterized protein LOC133486746 [Phyllopteryx taeniolatus]|uniref:uncharacterized protein LOC133486746 n=1 Tax=Phyllopteryx taeniolatus TaxID=161469 RepID=UPI002AD38A56|nr:uncharacterized protein LOC133486746 [Phyllopteryx taeniolatus]